MERAQGVLPAQEVVSLFMLYSTKYLTDSESAASVSSMATPSPLRSPNREPIPIDARAADHLRYIRETMESAAEFTAVPGWGGVAMGITALVAAVIASRQVTPRAWLTVWLIESFVAVAVAAPAPAPQTHRANSALFSRPRPEIVLSFSPPLVVGGLFAF